MRNTLDKPQELRISEITQKYPKQWVAVEVTERDKYGLPVKGKVTIQANRIEQIEDKINDIPGDLYIFYTGSIDDELD